MQPGYFLPLVLTVVIVVIAAIIAVVRREHRPPDYFVLFLIGLIWFPVGLALQSVGLWGLGLAGMAYALVHRDKWRTQRRDWEHMDLFERNVGIIIFALITFLVLVIVGYILFFAPKL